MAAPVRQLPVDRTHPATHGAVITPSDVTTFVATRGLWVGGAGNVRVTMVGDAGDVIISGVAAGTLLPISVTAVLSTNTTATLIVALW